MDPEKTDLLSHPRTRNTLKHLAGTKFAKLEDTADKLGVDPEEFRRLSQKLESHGYLETDVVEGQGEFVRVGMSHRNKLLRHGQQLSEQVQETREEASQLLGIIGDDEDDGRPEGPDIEDDEFTLFSELELKLDEGKAPEHVDSASLKEELRSARKRHQAKQHIDEVVESFQGIPSN